MPINYLVLLVLMASGPAWQPLTWVHGRNAAVAAGTAAYARGDAGRAAGAFATALAARGGRQAPDPRLLLNLAHAQTRAGQLAPARATYGRLLNSSPAGLASVARQQLAILAAAQGEVAQALGLLRQALLLDPRNAGARFDYEVLSEYLAQHPRGPQIPSPAPAPEPTAPKPAAEKGTADQNQPAERAGSDREGFLNDPEPAAPTPPGTSPDRRPDPTGQADNRRPNAAPGNAAAGSREPGAGTPQSVASGEGAGSQRGLDRNSTGAAAPAPNRSTRPGTDAATPADLRLQTQRERLQAMNLSPAQARQLLETLRAQEQQYLQQVSRPGQQKPDPSKPTW